MSFSGSVPRRVERGKDPVGNHALLHCRPQSQLSSSAQSHAEGRKSDESITHFVRVNFSDRAHVPHFDLPL